MFKLFKKKRLTVAISSGSSVFGIENRIFQTESSRTVKQEDDRSVCRSRVRYTGKYFVLNKEPSDFQRKIRFLKSFLNIGKRVHYRTV